MIKDKLKRSLISHPISARALYHYYRIKHIGAVQRASEIRKTYSLFDFTALAQDIPYCPNEIVIDNNLYGQAFSIKRYAQINYDLQAYIEHGLFWGGMVHQDEYHWYTPRIITFSERRRKDIAAKGIPKETVAIGPYIHYAEPLLQQAEFDKLKAELGKTLLVFPSKSILNIESKYDLDSFIDEVKRIGAGYKSILVSLFYLDARNQQLTAAYKSHGFKVVTAGHRYDNYFLDRQRTLLALADMSISNEVGTHVGYCTHLGIPHYIFKQSLERVGANAKELARELTLYEAEEDKRRNAEKDEVAAAFSTFNGEIITEEQRAVVNKFWGIASVRTPQDLHNLLTS